MSIASILVHLDHGEACESRLKCARSLADHFGAAIIGIGAEAVPPLNFDNGYATYDALWQASMQEAIGENLKASRARFESVCHGFGTAREWREARDIPAMVIARACRAADLVLAKGGKQGDAYQTAPADELALTCGRPVLVVPTGADCLSARKVMVAWKDTREARRALADALPFLQGAQDVLVVEVCDQDQEEYARARVDDVTAGLARHGVTAVAEVDAGQGDAEARIEERAALFGADLIVAGAYGHSRVGEWVFGGVTRSLIHQDRRFVLLSH